MFFLLSLCADVFRCSVFSELLYALSLQNYHMLCLFKIIICSAYPILSYALSIRYYYMLCLSDTIICSVYSILLYALSIRYDYMLYLFDTIICPHEGTAINLSIYLSVCLFIYISSTLLYCKFISLLHTSLTLRCFHFFCHLLLSISLSILLLFNFGFILCLSYSFIFYFLLFYFACFQSL